MFTQLLQSLCQAIGHVLDIWLAKLLYFGDDLWLTSVLIYICQMICKKGNEKNTEDKRKKKKKKKNNDETKPNKTQHMSHTRCILRQRSPISTEKISPGNQLSLTRKYCFIYLTFSLLLLTEKKLSKIVEDTFTCSKHHSLRK